jgi:hypothetical protein
MSGIAKKGDVIFVDRGLYKHYGVYNSEKSVIHFSPDKGKEISAEDAYIRETTLAEFLKGGDVQVDRNINPAFPPDEIARRALSLAGSSRGKYNLLFFNCEHFARWCATGELESKQVKKGIAIAGTIAATAAAAVLVTKAILDRDKDGQA